MGAFHQPIEIGLSAGGPFRTIEAMVDTGATYTWIPRSILAEIGVEASFRRPFVTADGRQIERDMGTIYVRIDGRGHPSPCIFGDEGSTPLLGVVTLEELGFGVDPVNRRLIEVPGMLMAVRHRLVPASEPDADPACRLEREEGQRRQGDMDRLFAALAEQRQTGAGNEFVFRGDAETLWREVSAFVDEEARCCPFFTYEQVERADGVLLRVSRGSGQA